MNRHFGKGNTNGFQNYENMFSFTDNREIKMKL